MMPSDMPLKEVADKLDDWAQCCFDCDDSEGNEVAEQAASLVRKVDTGELVEVKHGIPVEDHNGDGISCGFYHCSVCHHPIKKHENYCANCGARMDGKDGSNE